MPLTCLRPAQNMSETRAGLKQVSDKRDVMEFGLNTTNSKRYVHRSSQNQWH